MSFISELACAATGTDAPATAAWLRVALAQDRPAALQRVEAHWPLLEEHEQSALYEEVVNGTEGSLELHDARVPHRVVADYAELAARANHLLGCN
jgi:hypothetical protein